jgi:hypothetical protein
VTVERLEASHLGRSLWAELWEREKDLPLVSRLSRYAAYRHPYSTWYWEPGMTLVVLTDDQGRQGLGWTEDGTGAARLMIERHLRRFRRRGVALRHGAALGRHVPGLDPVRPRGARRSRRSRRSTSRSGT